MRNIRESFFSGWDFVPDDALNARARQSREEQANVRNHGTLKERLGQYPQQTTPPRVDGVAGV